MIVAYFITHNDGDPQWGTLQNPGETVEAVDLFECDITIQAFATAAEAERWLGEQLREAGHRDYV